MIRVLLVDDSAVSRRLFARALRTQPGVEVVGEAADAFAARDLIVSLRPDVLVLDVQMPRMDGIEFLRRLNQHYPLPVVVCSASAVAGGDTVQQALQAGALQVIGKPSASYGLSQFTRDLSAAVREAVRAKRPHSHPPQPSPVATAAGAQALASETHLSADPAALIAIGASTGGTVAVETIVRALSPTVGPVVIVQHMPAYITEAFARRLAQLSRLEVLEARDGMSLQSGVVLIAPGGQHVLIERGGRALRARLHNGPRVNGHRPAVDVLFHSVATAVGEHALGVLLTGMGRDGAEGMLAMRQAGARTWAQDEASSVVWGMPRAAIELGAAQEVMALSAIAGRIARPG